MSTYLSQCLKNHRFFHLDKETILAKDMNPKFPGIKLSIFLLNKLLKNAISRFYVREWFYQPFFLLLLLLFPWGKLKLYINFKQN